MVTAATMLSMIGPAFAYLDPGTGSMMLQLLLGGIAGALVIIKLYWHRLKSVISFRRGSSAPTPTPRTCRGGSEHHSTADNGDEGS